MGALGAFWSYENMGIDDLATKEVIKQVLLGAPYIGGKSLSLSPQQLYNNVSYINSCFTIGQIRQLDWPRYLFLKNNKT